MISNFTFSSFSSPCGLLINIFMTSVKAALFICFDLLTGATISTSDDRRVRFVAANVSM